MRPASFFSALIIACVMMTSFQAKASGAKRPQGSDSAYGIYPEMPSDGTNVSEKYNYLDPDHEVPSELLTKALNFYEANPALIKNKDNIIIINFKEHNSKKRFYMIDMRSGNVDRFLVAHGKNSDPDFDGYATKFSNTPDSLMSSLGFYLTAETYYGEHGYSLRLDGISNTNSNARSRAIVIHGASYVNGILPVIGRSYGCPALDEDISSSVIDMIKGGTLIYAGY